MQTLIATCSILGFYLTTRATKRAKITGALIGLAGQPLWFYTVDYSSWGVLVVAAFFTFIYVEVLITNITKQQPARK